MDNEDYKFFKKLNILVYSGLMFFTSVFYNGFLIENYNNTKKSIELSDNNKITINNIVSKNYQIYKTKSEIKQISDSNSWPPICYENLWKILPKPGDTGIIERINYNNGFKWKENVYVDLDSNIYFQRRPIFFENENNHFKYIRKSAAKK
jgi:hypothetical protein